MSACTKPSQHSFATGTWLEVLASLVAALGVPHRIVAGGGLVRGAGQDRIAFLAMARNAALEPLWLSSPAVEAADPGTDQHSNGSRADQRAVGNPGRRLVRSPAHTAEVTSTHDPSRQLQHWPEAGGKHSAAATAAAADSSTSSACGGRRRELHERAGRDLRQQSAKLTAPAQTVTPSRVWRSNDEAAQFQADRVLFLNDAYSCAAGALRLLRHDADLVCGMDFDRPALRQMSRKVRPCNQLDAGMSQTKLQVNCANA